MVSIPDWLKEICVWLSDNVAGGVIAGIVLFFFVSVFIEKMREKRDRKKIYKWLYNETKNYSTHTIGGFNDPRWRSMHDIARYNNLTFDRVNYICSIDKRVLLIDKENKWHHEEEMWAIKEFVDKIKHMPRF